MRQPAHLKRAVAASATVLALMSSPASAPHAAPAVVSTRCGSLASGFINRENAKPGDIGWKAPTTTDQSGPIGYLSTVSASCGETVRVFLSAPAATDVTLTAYRLGYYHGAGGRRVWTSRHLRVRPQRAAAPVRGHEHLVEAGWRPTSQFTVGKGWTPGEYLLKVTDEHTRKASLLPLVIKAPVGTRTQLGFMNSTMTMQAYNYQWRYSLYKGPDAKKASRARVVSYDRPYARIRDYTDLELPAVRLVEQLGLDTAYFTDVDLSADPSWAFAGRALVFGSHAEYWTRQMRDAAAAARDSGINLLNLGGNAAYWQVRLISSPTGANRRIVAYKDDAAHDPIADIDPRAVTGRWRDAPTSDPESSLWGSMWECDYPKIRHDVVVSDPSSWLLAGTHATVGTRIKGLLGWEYDRPLQRGSATPRNLDAVTVSPLGCKTKRDTFGAMTYYTAGSGAGVFDAGTTDWVCSLALQCWLPGAQDRKTQAFSRQVTRNLLLAAVRGPLGLAHPTRAVLPASPTVQTISTASGRLDITWSRVPGAMLYTVWVARTGHAYHVQTTTARTAFRGGDYAHAGQYRVRVQALNAAGASPASQPQYVTAG